MGQTEQNNNDKSADVHDKKSSGLDLPDIWLTWVATDDWDMRRRVIATWVLIVAIILPIVLSFALRIYAQPADFLIQGFLLLSLGAYGFFRIFRSLVRTGSALLMSALWVVAFESYLVIQLLSKIQNP